MIQVEVKGQLRGKSFSDWIFTAFAEHRLNNTLLQTPTGPQVALQLPDSKYTLASVSGSLDASASNQIPHRRGFTT